MKNVLEVAQKKDSVDVFTAFLISFKDIVHSQALKPERLLVGAKLANLGPIQDEKKCI